MEVAASKLPGVNPIPEPSASAGAATVGQINIAPQDDDRGKDEKLAIGGDAPRATKTTAAPTESSTLLMSDTTTGSAGVSVRRQVVAALYKLYRARTRDRWFFAFQVLAPILSFIAGLEALSGLSTTQSVQPPLDLSTGMVLGANFSVLSPGSIMPWSMNSGYQSLSPQAQRMWSYATDSVGHPEFGDVYRSLSNGTIDVLQAVAGKNLRYARGSIVLMCLALRFPSVQHHDRRSLRKQRSAQSCLPTLTSPCVSIDGRNCTVLRHRWQPLIAYRLHAVGGWFFRKSAARHLGPLCVRRDCGSQCRVLCCKYDESHYQRARESVAICANQ
jgi:hypothetical protein